MRQKRTGRTGRRGPAHLAYRRPDGGRHWRLIAALLGLLAGPAAAQTPTARAWLPDGAALAADLAARPAEALAGHATFYSELGRLAFRSAAVLGGNARRIGLSCQSCHTNGHANGRFHIAGLSEAPGSVDVTHSFWHLRHDDGVANPLPIPTLRGVAGKARLGQPGMASLHDFVRRVIVVEFAGADPPPAVLDGLVAYLARLAPAPDAAVAVTLAGDLDDLSRHLATLDAVLRDEDAPLAPLVATMVREQIGLIAERFHRPWHQGAVAELRDWALAVRGAERQAAAGRFGEARLAVQSVNLRLDSTLLRDSAASSLYNPVVIEREAGQ